MTIIREPWTFEPFEIYEDQAWSILDPNMASHVAIFFDRAEAEAYLAWRNKKQAKQEAKKARKATAGQHRADGFGRRGIDLGRDIDWDDGRCLR